MELQKNSIKPLIWVLALSFFFFFLFLGFSSWLYLFYLPDKKIGIFASKKWSSLEKGIGLVEVKGSILESKKVIAQLEHFKANAQVKAIVLRLDSPGGAIAPSQEIYQALKTYPKPVVTSMSNLATSGAYYIALGTQKIFANPGTFTGSIGVIMHFVNLEKLYEWIKVDHYAVKSGPYKDLGANYRRMSSEEHLILEEIANDILSQFKEVIVERRQLSQEQVNRIADGRIFSGRQAQKLGLIDELGSFNDAIRAAADLGGIKGQPTLIKKPHAQSWKKLNKWKKMLLLLNEI